MKKKLAALLRNSIETCIGKEILSRGDILPVGVELPREGAHGDYASNIAMVLASTQKTNPRKIAGAIAGNIDDSEGILEKIEVAGPGFINFFIKKEAWISLLEEVDMQGDLYGESDAGRGKKVQVEFVSANPTGPLHIGHARGAVTGDVIASILSASGYEVSREYYINDAGTQMQILGKSVWYRYRELMGGGIEFPADCYQGDYIRDLAKKVQEQYGESLSQSDEKDAISILTGFAAGIIMEGIRDDLCAFGVIFDRYFSESELYRDDGVMRLLDELRGKGHVFEDAGALWFRTTAFGDEKDRVVVRENGEPTYFAADIAYHRNKYARGFDIVIDIWGADHHGYIPRMYAGIQALGKNKSALEIVLVQLVNLLRRGKPVAMSTRAGEFVTLREVLDEVGKDAARYNFLMRRSNSHLDFDLELAKEQSSDNPVYYVQYAHARIASIIRTAAERGHSVPRFSGIDAGLLGLPEELTLVKLIGQFPELIEGSAQSLEPHRITFYCNELASTFHGYYNKHRVVTEDEGLTKARLFLVAAVQTVLRNALRLLGVTAPEKM
ncbi:MAG: arginine--tRNA ligase [Deltaproteobacteria bacterium]|nr:arginine--tRNA ligase [Deltaproteobacteria bacterium]